MTSSNRLRAPLSSTIGGPIPEDPVFGKYRVVRALGAGGMAQVFLASLDGPDGFSKTCVVKRIRPEYALDEAYAQMFVNEAKVAAMLSHPNIVHVFEFAKEQGTYFLAMEYVAGASLERIVRVARAANLPLGPRTAVEIGIPVAHALAYVHAFAPYDGGPSLRLVHRDVTPGNVLVSREGIVKLADFGVAQSTMTAQNTAVGVVKGKLPYMSPEQVSGQPIDGRSDIFSLGIILYELTTGHRLFKGDSVGATALAVMRGRIPLPSQLLPNVPAELERIVMTALARDLRKRYPSASALAADLEAFRLSRSWGAGSNHLGTLVTSLFSMDRTASATVPANAPGSGLSRTSLASGSPEVASSEIGVARPPADGEVVGDFEADGGAAHELLISEELDIFEEGLDPPEKISAAAVAGAVAATLLCSAVFWYLVLRWPG